ncbi:MAG TPA: recombinase XerC [Nautiliaceae bacterium]|nr:recombinase XerC [Nautiliaceae bacterium]
MSDVLELYKSELEIQGYTKNTVKTYLFFIKEFLEFLKKKKKGLGELDKALLKEFLLKSHSEKKYAIKSFYNLVLALKSFLKFIEREDLLIYLKLPKLPKSLPKALSKEEIKKLINSANNIRDKLIVLLFYSTGLRVSELRNLNLNDINLEDKFLIVKQGKGRKDRVIPLSDKIIDLIKEYLKWREERFKGKEIEKEAFFLNKNGRRISTVSLEKIVRNLGKKIGIKVTCHMLRHSFATHMLENGADIRVIQEILGHEKLSTTQIYTKVTTKYLREVYLKYNPLKDL